jgi:hypothetical protein
MVAISKKRDLSKDQTKNLAYSVEHKSQYVMDKELAQMYYNELCKVETNCLKTYELIDNLTKR